MANKNGQRHIVMLHKAYPPWVGGVERHICDISESLVERGWKVTALVCNDACFETREIRNGVRVIRVPKWGKILSQPLTTRTMRWLKCLEPDVVHAHTPYPMAWLAARRVAKSVPLICTWHSDIVRQKFIMPLLRPLEKRFLKRCEKIIATSPRLIEHSKALAPVREKCISIPLSLPPDERNKLGNVEKNKSTKPTILFVGRLVGYKGLNFLVHAMKSIDANLIIAGDGPQRKLLERLIQAANLSNKISFLGYVDEDQKIKLYQQSDLFVLPSVSANEAFGYVLLEAMNEGLPVVSCDLPTGVSYVNQHEHTGLLVPPKNSKALADAIQRILRDETLRRKFGENAKKRVLTEFNFYRCMDQLEAVYHQALPNI